MALIGVGVGTHGTEIHGVVVIINLITNNIIQGLEVTQEFMVVLIMAVTEIQMAEETTTLQ